MPPSPGATRRAALSVRRGPRRGFISPDRELDTPLDAMLGQVRGEIPRIPTTSDLRHPRRELRDRPVQQVRRDRAAGLRRPSSDIRGPAHITLGPERDMRPVGTMALVVVDRVLLLAPVHLHIDGVPVGSWPPPTNWQRSTPNAGKLGLRRDRNPCHPARPHWAGPWPREVRAWCCRSR